MPAASGQMELWRRLALLLGILAGLGLFFYVTPAVVGVTAVNWEQEQADELKSISGYVSQENKRRHQLPMADYIKEKTGNQAIPLDSSRWEDFFIQARLAGTGQYGDSVYGKRVSEEDKDPFWKPTGMVPVFFKPGEMPFAEWGLVPEDGDELYISTTIGGKTEYLLLRYQN